MAFAQHRLLPALLLSLCALGSFDPLPAEAGQNTAELSRHAWSLLRSGKRQEALSEFDRIIELDPDNAAAYRGRGIILVYLQKAEKAKADLEKSLTKEPTFQGYFALGAACINLDSIDEALEAYDRAMRLKLGSHMAHMMRGRCYYVLGKYDLAVKDFDQAISLKPSVWKFHIYRAQAYEALGKKKKAEEDFEQAFLLEPGYATAFFEPDMIKSIKEIQASGARVTVRKGSLQGPSPQPELWFRRGLKRLKAGQNQAAMSDFMVVSQADSPLSDFACRFRGLTYLQMKHYDQALCGLNVALFYDRTWVTGYYYKAKTLEILGRRAEAARFYKLYLERLARAGGAKAKDPMGYESPGRYEKEVRQWLAQYKK